MQFHLFNWLIIVPLAIYTILIFITCFSWLINLTVPGSATITPIPVSIIIAARNESKTLPLLLKDLYLQNYPRELIEVIVVDDHSNIPIRDLPEISDLKLNNLSIIELEKQSQGKKSAIKIGVECSHNNYLLFTDADCRLNPNWIMSHVEAKTENMADFVIGLTDYTNLPGFLNTFMRLDLISLNMITSAAVYIKKPILCSAANLSVSREVYNTLNDKLRPEIASGDDVFLLHAAKKNNRVKIAAVTKPISRVLTHHPKKLTDFLNQRARWASKSKYYTDKDTLFVSALILFLNIAMTISFTAAVFFQNWNFFLFIQITKTLADCLLFTIGLKFYKSNFYWLMAPVYSIVYPLYLLLVIIYGSVKPIQWKGR